MFIAGTKPKVDIQNNNNLSAKLKQPMAKSNIKRTNISNNNSAQNEKRAFKPKFFNHEFQPAYARPTIATTARGVCIAKTIAAKNLAKTKAKQLETERLTAGQLMKKEKLKENIPIPTPILIEEQEKEEVGIQTNEGEIINHELVVGDVKLLLPSPAIVTVIESTRKEKRKQAELSARRKYDMIDEKKSAHLSDLKQFLESATIKKNSATNAMPAAKIQITSKKRTSEDFQTKLKNTCKNTQSILSMKSRIKQKENELLSLFDNVETL